MKLLLASLPLVVMVACPTLDDGCLSVDVGAVPATFHADSQDVDFVAAVADERGAPVAHVDVDVLLSIHGWVRLATVSTDDHGVARVTVSIARIRMELGEDTLLPTWAADLHGHSRYCSHFDEAAVPQEVVDLVNAE